MLGAGCKIGECSIDCSILARHCRVGNQAKIDNSHMFRGVIVEADAVVTYSVLAEDVVVKRGAVVSRGCVLGKGVIVGEGVVLAPFTRLTCFGFVERDEWGEKLPASEIDLVSEEHVLGEDGTGRRWSFGEDSQVASQVDEEEGDKHTPRWEDLTQGVWARRKHAMGAFELEQAKLNVWPPSMMRFDEEEEESSDEFDEDFPVGFEEGLVALVHEPAVKYSQSEDEELLDVIYFAIQDFRNKREHQRSLADCLEVMVPMLLQPCELELQKDKKRIFHVFKLGTELITTHCSLLAKIIDSKSNAPLDMEVAVLKGCANFCLFGSNTSKETQIPELAACLPFLVNCVVDKQRLISEQALEQWFLYCDVRLKSVTLVDQVHSLLEESSEGEGSSSSSSSGTSSEEE